MEGSKIKVNIKQAADKKFELELPLNATISEIKELCAKQASCKSNELKLIYKGSLYSFIIF